MVKTLWLAAAREHDMGVTYLAAARQLLRGFTPGPFLDGAMVQLHRCQHIAAQILAGSLR